MAICFQPAFNSVESKVFQDLYPATVNHKFKEAISSIYTTHIPVFSVQELRKHTKGKVYLLDARSKEEYEVSHIKDAQSVGYHWFDMRSVYGIPKDATIITYCAVGNRSIRIADKLIKAGYKHVFVLYGGIFEWVNEGNPVYMQQDIQTTLVHGYTEEWKKWVESGNTIL